MESEYPPYLDSIAQLVASCKGELTTAEALLWIDAVEKLGSATLLDFVAFWASGTAGTHRPPKVEDFRVYGDPSYVNEERAITILQDLVARVGPYQAPAEVPARVAAMIHALGGWVAVCEKAPDPSNDFAMRPWLQACAVAYRQALAAEVARLPPAPMPIGLTEARRTVALGSRPQQPILAHGTAPHG